MEFKLFVFWAAFTTIMWVAAKAHYCISDTALNWKHFKENVSTFGALYIISMYAGLVVIPTYFFVRIAQWWFNY